MRQGLERWDGSMSEMTEAVLMVMGTLVLAIVLLVGLARMAASGPSSRRLPRARLPWRRPIRR